jgi:hypothetical protein
MQILCKRCGCEQHLTPELALRRAAAKAHKFLRELAASEAEMEHDGCHCDWCRKMHALIAELDAARKEIHRG